MDILKASGDYFGIWEIRSIRVRRDWAHVYSRDDFDSR